MSPVRSCFAGVAMALVAALGPAMAEPRMSPRAPSASDVTRLTGGSCRFLAAEPGAEGELKRCLGPSGIGVETLAEHTWVTLRLRLPSMARPARIVRAYTVGTTLEWRRLNGRLASAIISVTPKDIDTLDPGGVVLAVLHLGRDTACLAAVIDRTANRDAESQARRAADATAGFSCANDGVVTIGPSTRWTQAVIAGRSPSR